MAIETVHLKEPGTPSYGPALCDDENSLRGATHVCYRLTGDDDLAGVASRLESQGSQLCHVCVEKSEEVVGQ